MSTKYNVVTLQKPWAHSSQRTFETSLNRFVLLSWAFIFPCSPTIFFILRFNPFTYEW